MTIIQKFMKDFKKKYNFQLLANPKLTQIKGFNPIGVLFFLIFFSVLFFTSTNLINKKNVKFLISKLDQKSRIEITRLNKNVIIKS